MGLSTGVYLTALSTGLSGVFPPAPRPPARAPPLPKRSRGPLGAPSPADTSSDAGRWGSGRRAGSSRETLGAAGPWASEPAPIGRQVRGAMKAGPVVPVGLTQRVGAWPSHPVLDLCLWGSPVHVMPRPVCASAVGQRGTAWARQVQGSGRPSSAAGREAPATRKPGVRAGGPGPVWPGPFLPPGPILDRALEGRLHGLPGFPEQRTATVLSSS